MTKKRLFLFLLLLSLLTGWFAWKLLAPKEVKPRASSFSKLPGWGTTNTRQPFSAFKNSCKVFLNSDPNKFVGSDSIHLKVKDWLPACKAALQMNEPEPAAITQFFEAWFQPVAFQDHKPVQGLFTGYYMPLLKGSLTRTEKYTVPIYGEPDDIITVNLEAFDPHLRHQKIIGRIHGKHLKPYHTRKEINEGALGNHAPVLVWIESEIDRQFLEIEGSGVVELTDKSRLFLGYAAQNGAPYTSIARVLIDRGIMTKDNASMQRIRAYFKHHPEKIHPILNQNKSFVFFNKLKKEEAIGSQGIALTPGYSLAVDQKWVPIGTPIWLQTTHPHKHTDQSKDFQRLMVAQDTGGAIRGAVRGDVYWGTGKRAEFIAGHMKNPGYYWLMLPKHVCNTL